MGAVSGVGVLGVGKPAEGAADAFGTAYQRVMAPPHAPSAQSGTGPGCCASDLTVSTANDDRFVDEGAGQSARYGIVNVDPRNTSVTVGRCPHEADDVLEDGGQLLSDWQDCKRIGEGVALGGLPRI
ncbi:hypothetical protein Agabi119p4_8348 [Agaricus bisporus var. burnettii]|uniref:Uncharacterized protein n=1 Tax=Agaricus bisporus var. burnettii TaxID=192524 RepID=A0A8H7C6F6_AGABI|nr:hypothetical protein Agabi119p4_8348 [Agaricus bisporus var. burnettii]